METQPESVRPSIDNPVIRKLERLVELAPEDRRLLARALSPPRTVEPRSDIVTEGPTPGYCVVLLEGLACRYKALDDGRRQILSLLAPGDVVDVAGFVMRRLDHSVAALSRCRIATIAHDAMHEILAGRLNILMGLWRDSLLDGAMFRAWLVSLGQRPAYERIAHLLCEITARLRMAGAAAVDGFHFPVTQEELGDALGLSVVHVNRVLQKLRADGLITLRGRRLTIHDGDALARVGGFDPRYLLPPDDRSAF